MLTTSARTPSEVGPAPETAPSAHTGVPAFRREEVPPAFFFSHSEAMRSVRAQIGPAAATDATILIEGESGSGKSLVAYALHARSARAHRPLVKINCATLPAPLLESELFGHERGAFTGADRRKRGKFELAHGGTILLDEIGELPLALQAKLLQVLQDGEFAPVGGTHDLRVDVRVLAASNCLLAQAVAAGTFRADLYYRLNVIRIEVPPLRDRREEIPILAEHFLRTYAARYNRPMRGLAPETLTCMLDYAWPGNVRELENLVKRVVVMENEGEVREALAAVTACPAASETDFDLKAAVRRAAGAVERTFIQEALERTRGNRAAAARLLHISTRALGYKLQKLEDPVGEGGTREERGSFQREVQPFRPTVPGLPYSPARNGAPDAAARYEVP